MTAWEDLHRAAARAKSADEFRAILTSAVAKQKCGTCTKHADDFMALTPIPEGNGETYLYYSWLYHKDINDKLGKQNSSWKETRAKYLGGGGSRLTSILSGFITPNNQRLVHAKSTTGRSTVPKTHPPYPLGTINKKGCQKCKGNR